MFNAFKGNQLGGVMIKLIIHKSDRRWLRSPIGTNQRAYNFHYARSIAELEERMVDIRNVSTSGVLCLYAE